MTFEIERPETEAAGRETREPWVAQPVFLLSFNGEGCRRRRP